jgi:aspartyl-tRNA(Asn)/glutamyl-tRNA(Gln) amidotransferase subunit B
VAEVKAGKAAAAQFLVGQVMKATKGKANPQVVQELLQKVLST